jgi:hypothetical protein
MSSNIATIAIEPALTSNPLDAIPDATHWMCLMDLRYRWRELRRLFSAL